MSKAKVSGNVRHSENEQAAAAPMAQVAAKQAAKTEPTPHGLSVDSLIATLSNPQVRESARNQLNERIRERAAELEQLMQARDALAEPEQKPVQPAASAAAPAAAPQAPRARRGRRPASESNGSDHTSAILAALQGEKNGLNAGDIGTKLTQQGHPIESKILASYIWRMSSDGKLKKSGTRGNFIYKTA